MKAFALTTLALLGVTSAVQTHRIKQSLAQLDLPADTATHTCAQAVTRVNAQANFDYNSVINAGANWTDPQFPAPSSIYWQDFNGGSTSGMIGQIAWDRARNRNATASLFGNGNLPVINNIHQGALGDCYYLSSISATAEWPDRIKGAFLTQTYNKAGIFALKVYIRGKPTTIVVDDFLPFSGTSGNYLIFDQVFQGEGIWAAVLEKAWAKASGTYDVTSGGWMSEAVGFLTGAPSTTYSNSDASTVNNDGPTAWNIVNAADASQLIITAGVGGSGCDANGNNAYHLPCGHAYSLLGTYTIKNAAGTVTNRLFRMRNPWGVDAGYNGNWNDNDSTRWTALAKAQVPYVNADDGAFFIEDVDFVKSYDSFVISYFRAGWVNNIVDVTNDTAAPQRTWTFTLTTPQEIFIGMEFYDSRMYAKGCKATTTGIQYLQNSAGSWLGAAYTYDWNGYNNFHFTTLAAGTYTYMFQPQWNAQDVRDYTVRLYANSTIALTPK